MYECFTGRNCVYFMLPFVIIYEGAVDVSVKHTKVKFGALSSTLISFQLGLIFAFTDALDLQ